MRTFWRDLNLQLHIVQKVQTRSELHNQQQKIWKLWIWHMVFIPSFIIVLFFIADWTLLLLVDRFTFLATWVLTHFIFAGSSRMMEVEAARVLWRRSVQRHKLRYTTLLSDGDAKTFAELTKIKTYGEDIEIDKEECVNHVSKRRGSALRNIVTDCRKRGVTLGGRGKGQLTQNAIRKMTIYYNRAIRGSNSVDSMKKAVMASLHQFFL